MDKKLEEVKLILAKYKQEHLLDFYEELNNEEKEVLVNQILNTDFEQMKRLYDNSFKDDTIEISSISPIDYIAGFDLDEIKKHFYISLGEMVIKKGELAVITLAGGQGTRLGIKGPKGCYELDTTPKKSLFEFLCDKLKNAKEKYGVYLNWYIMTNIDNDNQTKNYFEEKNYFGYPKEKIYFFKQNKLPILDVEGKVFLNSIYSIKESSNGNGDVFNAFKKAELSNTLEHIKYISISGVDNILLETIDPLFIGIAEYNKSQVASKSIAKENVVDTGWVFANVDGRPNIIDPNNLTEEMKYSKNNDEKYNYNQINILAHLFTKEAFLDSMDYDLPYHRAYKKNDYINDEGMKVVAETPNSFKFEKFIFDVFKNYDKFTLMEVKKEDEFAPIKAFTGTATPEIALEMYLDKMKRMKK
ncbi:MAG: UTP--glucose-1-phosphate uridylyltransferase [Clostridia bacterium]|nr:UTP--glucose-1-phosphate uridylyltransferase [Clostridia bacterium]